MLTYPGQSYLTRMSRVFIYFLTVLSYSNVISQIDPVSKENLALGGYDVVSYFQMGKPAKGDRKFAAQHQSITYWFTSAEHQQLFQKDPERYLPQFEGYCALAVSYGKKISVDPETYSVKDGKLYLFFHGKTSRGMVNSLETWQKDEQRLLRKAEKYWPDLKKKKYKAEETL